MDDQKSTSFINSDSNISPSTQLAKIEAKLALYEERIQSQSQENEELRKHIAGLEKLLEKNESLVNLKDENLSILQQRNNQGKEDVADNAIGEEIASEDDVVKEDVNVKDKLTKEGDSVKEADIVSEAVEEIAKVDDLVVT